MAVAKRLIENPNLHFLVIEANVNHDDDLRVNFPAFQTSQMGSEVD